eukprot:COSAG04_NODE_332_length_16554_cov_392.698590_11_plen_101_part_00
MQGFAQGWRSDPAQAGGGNTIDGGTHWVRALRVWMGEVDRLVAINERPFKARRPSPLAPRLAGRLPALCASPHRVRMRVQAMAGESLTHAILRYEILTEI